MEKAVYRAEMTMTIRFNILANSEEEAQEYIQTHDIADIMNASENYADEYDEEIIERLSGDVEYAIDITHTTYGISVKALYEEYGENLTYCKIEKTEDENETYYDLFNSKGMLSLMDGEEAEILSTINDTYKLIGDTYIFELTPEEFGIATFK